MKVKAWHIGCLVVLVLAAMYFLVSVREGMGAPPSAAAPLPPPDLNGTWKVNGTDYDSKITQSGDTWTLTPSSTAAGWTSISGKFDAGSAKTGTLVYSTPGGPLNMTYTLDGSNSTITGSNGGSFSRVVTSSVLPPGPAGTAGGASMTPAVPSPTPSTASYPAYSLTCMAAPVSGMVGSAAGMPETPAAWNVSQPPSGWNSKNGYTTTGN